MRDALMKSLFMLADKDPNLMLLTGDLGYGVFEEFEKKYPSQYLNVGFKAKLILTKGHVNFICDKTIKILF